jgi:hypothetical protein
MMGATQQLKAAIQTIDAMDAFLHKHGIMDAFVDEFENSWYDKDDEFHKHYGFYPEQDGCSVCLHGQITELLRTGAIPLK